MKWRHVRHGVSNNRQFGCLCNRLFRLITRRHHIIGPLRGWIRLPAFLLGVDSPHKGPVVRKALPCHDVIMGHNTTSRYMTKAKQNKPCEEYFDGLVQDCSISSALAMGILQSCAKQSIWAVLYIYIYHIVRQTLLLVLGISIIDHSNDTGPAFYLWVRKISNNKRRLYLCNVFSHWLIPC